MMRGYGSEPFFAWAGWRLKIPGGPVGGQYHGILGDDPSNRIEFPDHGLSGAGLGDSRSGWSKVWGGVALREGETVSDYVYRSPGEMQPRPNASGGANTVRSLQQARTAGYAEAPGNYAYIGGVVVPVGASTGRLRRPQPGPARPHPRPLHGLGVAVDTRGVIPSWFKLKPPNTVAAPTGASAGHPIYPAQPESGGVVMHPYDPVCPAWGCGHTPPIYYDPYPSGATATVPQPPPPQTPAVAPVVGDCKQMGPDYFRDSAGNCTNDWHNPYSLNLPVSPRPSPTVAASPSDFLPSQGQVVPGITPSSSSIMDWLTASTIWSAVPNGVLLAGAGVLLFSMGGRKK